MAIGGFLIFMGIIMLGTFALIFSGLADITVLEEISQNEGYRVLFLGVLLIIGLLDVASGVILRWR